jgi:hypothetical protein
MYARSRPRGRAAAPQRTHSTPRLARSPLFSLPALVLLHLRPFESRICVYRRLQRSSASQPPVEGAGRRRVACDPGRALSDQPSATPCPQTSRQKQTMGHGIGVLAGDKNAGTLSRTFVPCASTHTAALMVACQARSARRRSTTLCATTATIFSSSFPRALRAWGSTCRRLTGSCFRL